jgi:hypothetical protein
MHPDWPFHLAGLILLAAGGFMLAYAFIAATFERGLLTQAWLRWGHWRDPPDDREP